MLLDFRSCFGFLLHQWSVLLFCLVYHFLQLVSFLSFLNKLLSQFLIFLGEIYRHCYGGDGIGDDSDDCGNCGDDEGVMMMVMIMVIIQYIRVMTMVIILMVTAGYNSLFRMLVLNHLVIVILTAHGFFFSKTLIFSKCFSRS